MTVFDKISSLQGKERTPVWMVGEQLKDIIRNNEKAQEIVSQDLDVPEMSLAKCEAKIKAYADGHKTGNFACVTPIEAERIICEFYGIPIADKAEVKPDSAPLTLDSFFG
jgi:hypothetical protein